jgi:integrase
VRKPLWPGRGVEISTSCPTTEANLARTNHLVWRGSQAYWRRRLPADLAHRSERKEWCVPLGNLPKDAAKEKARYISRMSDELIRQQRARPLATADDLERFAKDYFKRLLTEYERNFVEKPIASAADGQTSLKQTIGILETKIKVLDAFLKGLPSTTKAAFSHALLQDRGMQLPEELYWTSSRLFFRADLAASQIALAHLQGNYGFEPNDRLFAVAMTTPSPSFEHIPPRSSNPTEHGPASSDAKAPASPSIRISAFLADYVRRKIEAVEDRWTEQTRLQNETTFRLFVEFTKDANIDRISEDTIVAFKDVLRGFPRNWGQNPKYRGKRIDDVLRIASGDDPKKLRRIGNKTINRHVSALGGAFSDAKARAKWKGPNPCSRLLEKKGRRASVASTDERRPYLSRELNALFRAPVWTGCQSERFWNAPGKSIFKNHRYFIPIIALFSGMREDEICKLCTDDVVRVGSHWAFHVADTEFGRVKEHTSVRTVPIHPAIVASGFIDYVVEKKKLGRIHLWPKLVRSGPDKTFAHSYQKQFAATKRAAGLTDKGLTFHSMRHNASLAMKDAGIDLAIREAILGHKSNSTTDAVYGAARIHWIERRFDSHRAAIIAIKYDGLILPFDFSEGTER